MFVCFTGILFPWPELQALYFLLQSLSSGETFGDLKSYEVEKKNFQEKTG